VNDDLDLAHQLEKKPTARRGSLYDMDIPRRKKDKDGVRKMDRFISPTFGGGLGQTPTKLSSGSPPSSPSDLTYDGDEFAEEIANLALDSQQLHSPSRSRSIELERERIKREYEIISLGSQEKRKAHEAGDKDERKRIIADHEHRLPEDSEERKAEEVRILDKTKDEKIEQEKRQYAAFLAEQAQKESKEREKVKTQIQHETRKRLVRFGYTHTQIEALVKEESGTNDSTRTTATTTTTTLSREGEMRNPVYPKINLKYLSLDTLRYYHLPWEYDPVRKALPYFHALYIY
jgi:hypothetical protein